MRLHPGEVGYGLAGIGVFEGLIDALVMGIAMDQHYLPGKIPSLRTQLFEKLSISRGRVAGICGLKPRVSLDDDQDA